MSGSASRPSLIQRKLWQSRRAHYLAVFESAMMMLRQREVLPVDEPNLVRELHFTTVTARRSLDPKGRFGSPFFEAQNLPDPDAEQIEPFEHKRPDIQWIHDDESAPDDRHREKSFIIECKRLGHTTASRWNLNEQYVISGVSRFHSAEWKYGLHMSEGMMIGFVQDMELPSTLEIVNAHLAVKSLPHLQLEIPIVDAGISRLSHEFERSFPHSPFRLIHRWLDIRDVPKAAKATITRSAKVPKINRRTKKSDP